MWVDFNGSTSFYRVNFQTIARANQTLHGESISEHPKAKGKSGSIMLVSISLNTQVKVHVQALVTDSKFYFCHVFSYTVYLHRRLLVHNLTSWDFQPS